ncbi:MAG: hypothetical protein ACM3ZC_13480 [Bacteroidota bacterium]
MFRVKNVTRHPLTIDLGDKRSLHLLPQAEEKISDADAGAPQVRALVRGGHIRLTQIDTPAKQPKKAGGD